MSILKVQEISKSYGSILALNGLNLQVEAGQALGLLGPNGSGKTTTLGIILGILKANSGNFIWFDGTEKNPRRRIGAILETPNFYPYLNAVENLEIVRRIKKSDNKDFDELLELVNLYSRRNSKFRTYSLGMKQRLAIAATLLSDPEVLIFDEPTNGLDPQGIAEVRNILTKITGGGRTVILASHILDEVEKICSHVAIIKKGNLLATGPVGSILSNDITLEIASNDIENLVRWLNDQTYVRKMTRMRDFLECQIDEKMDIAEISSQAYLNNIQLTHLVARKRRLEEEFLEITSNK